MYPTEFHWFRLNIQHRIHRRANFICRVLSVETEHRKDPDSWCDRGVSDQRSVTQGLVRPTAEYSFPPTLLGVPSCVCHYLIPLCRRGEPDQGVVALANDSSEHGRNAMNTTDVVVSDGPMLPKRQIKHIEQLCF